MERQPPIYVGDKPDRPLKLVSNGRHRSPDLYLSTSPVFNLPDLRVNDGERIG